MFQQGDSPDVEEVGERCDGKEPENKLVVLVFEHQNAVCLEIEQNADDGGDKVGDDVSAVEMEEMLEDEEEQVVDK